MRALVLLALCNLALGISNGLYGLSANLQLIKIAPSSGAITILSGSISNELEAQQLSVMDQVNGILYFIGVNTTQQTLPETLIGVSLSTGKMVANFPIPFAPSAFFGAGQSVCIDYQNKQFLIQGRQLATPNTVNLIKMDMTTGKWQNIISFEDVPVLGGAAEFDPINRIQVLTISTPYPSINLMGVNVDTGKIVYNVSYIPWNLETLNYDPKSGLMYGIGLTVFPNNTYVRTLLKFDALQGTHELVVNLPDYFIIQGSVAALDTNNRILYSYLEKGDAGPFYLLGVNIDTGKIVSSPQGCAENSNNCPWSVEYYSATAPSM